MTENRLGFELNSTLEQDIVKTPPINPILRAFEKNDQINFEKNNQIIDLKDKVEELKEKMFKDHLTGFENRCGLDRYKCCLKKEQCPLIIFVADLDNLKTINDTPDPNIGGHTNGDKYILSFVKFVNEIFPDNKKFRLGGDEFTIPLPNLDSKELEPIYKKLEDFNKKEQNPNKLEFTYAFDIVSSKEDFYDALKRADDKLVKAKIIKKSK